MKKIFTTMISWCLMQAVLYAQPGALDTTFANKGKFLAPYNTNPNLYIDQANDVIIQPDGKIIMVSNGIDYSKTDTGNAQDFTITRLNADGSLDNSFDGDGIAFIDFSTINFYSYDIGMQAALLPDGKIVVAGYAYDPYYIDSTNTYNYNDIAVARLNADGSLDKSFGTEGKKLIDLSALTGNANETNYSYDFATAITIRPSGKIIIAGHTIVTDGINATNYEAVIIQLNTNGNFDNNFNTNGIQLIPMPGADEVLYDLALQPDGKVLCSGYTVSLTTYIYDMMAIRLKANGLPDNSFDGDGLAFIDTGSPEEYGFSVALQADNKILLGGRQYVNGFPAFTLARLNSDGSPDYSFDGDGIQIYAQPNEYNYGSRGLVVQPDGKIIQSGGTNTLLNSDYNGQDNVEVIRYNTDGSLDESFGKHGRSVIDYGNWTEGLYDFGIDCALQPDGKIVVAGYLFDYIHGTYYGIAATRLLINGKLITLDGPGDQIATAAEGDCSVKVKNIGPIFTPSDLHPKVYYHMYGATQDSGIGSVSGKQFNIGVTTVVYTLASNPLQRAVFTVTVTGGKTVAGGVLDFDGVDDVVDLGNMSPISNGNYGQYSFEAWIKVRAYNTTDGIGGSRIFGDERNFNGGISVQLDSAGYIATFQPNVGPVTSTYKVPLDTWTHIAFVQNSSELDLYVNGNFVQTLLTAPNLHYDDYEVFVLGALTTDFVHYYWHFNGEMDEVRVWNYAICQGQIQNNMNCEISDYAPGLTAYYKFNQGIASCSNLNETFLYNNYGNKGTLNNFALSGSTSNWVEGYITGSCAPFAPLSLICPDPITVNSEPGQCSAIVNFSATAVLGCGSNATIIYSQDPGTYFYAGTTYVYVTAIDDLGNQAYCSFPVTVTENEPPVLITKDATIALDMYGNVYLDPYEVIQTVSDNCGLPNVYADPYYFDCNSLGSHLVTVSATDYSGNTTVGTATVTITPFVTTSFVTASPAPVQYSDVATFTAGIIGAANYYYGCTPATEVTFKVGQIALGTVSLANDGYGNLIATLDKQITKGFLDSLNSSNTIPLSKDDGKVTAIFKGGSSDAVQFKKKAFAQLPLGKEDAQLEYTGAQIINTQKLEVPLPVSVRLTDIDDGYRGDIINASVTFTIEALTSGASIIGPDSITISTVSFPNKDHTSGIFQGKFKVAPGGNKTAKFRVTAKGGNSYRGTINVTVIVSTSATTAVAGEGIASSVSKLPGVFNVTAMPNPSHTYFNLSVQSTNRFEKLSIRVMDVAGKVIELKQNVDITHSIQFGKEYRAGIYLVEIKQGQNMKVLKLIKL